MDPRTLLAGRNPYGNLGGSDWMQRLISGNSQGMPDWLRARVTQTVDEGGTPHNVLGNVSDQQLYDKDGNPVQQVGNEGSWYGSGDGSVIDWNKVRYDPDLGLVTDPSNTKSVTAASYKNFQTIGMLLAAAATAGAASGYLGGEAGLAGAGAEGGVGGTMTGLAGDESAGLAMGAGEGGAAGAAGGGGVGTMDAGLSSLFQGEAGMAPGVGGSEADWLAGAGAGGAGGGTSYPYLQNIPEMTPLDTTMPEMAQYSGQPWYQSMLQQMLSNPQGTARTALGTYSLLSSLAGQHSSSALVGNNNGGSPDGSSGTAAMFTPDLQSQFQMNPYLLRPVPFMSRG